LVCSTCHAKAALPTGAPKLTAALMGVWELTQHSRPIGIFGPHWYAHLLANPNNVQGQPVFAQLRQAVEDAVKLGEQYGGASRAQ